MDDLKVRRKEVPGKIGTEAGHEADGAAEAVGRECRVESCPARSDVAADMIERHMPDGHKLRD